MATASNVQDSLAYALDYKSSYECSAKGALGNVHKFGHKWIEPREQFAVAGYEAQIGIIHSLASAIFHSAWSLTAGKLFTDKEARSFAIQSWKDLGSNVVCALKAILGVICPSVADWADKKFQSVRPEVKEDQTVIDEEETTDTNLGRLEITERTIDEGQNDLLNIRVDED